MIESLRNLIMQYNLRGASLVAWDGEKWSGIYYFPGRPTGNIFGSVGSGYYRLYSDGEPLCIVDVDRHEQVTIRLFSNVKRTKWTAAVEAPIPWDQVDLASIVADVRYCNAGKRPLPRWNVHPTLIDDSVYA